MFLGGAAVTTPQGRWHRARRVPAGYCLPAGTHVQAQDHLPGRAVVINKAGADATDAVDAAIQPGRVGGERRCSDMNSEIGATVLGIRSPRTHHHRHHHHLTHTQTHNPPPQQRTGR